MSDARRILVIGATGLIGRPVTYGLVAAGHQVVALVRDPPRARAALPSECGIVRGDLRDEASVTAALDGVDAVYLSLANPMVAKRPAWDPDTEGARTVLACAERAGVRRILRLSALGIEGTTGGWWVARVKRAVDEELLASNIACTIFRPTWLMESIALPAVGPFLLRLPGPDDPIRWLAGDDYARQVAAALADDGATGIYRCQGPEGVSMADAHRRFRAVWRRHLVPLPIPRLALALGARIVPELNYLDHLLRMTYETIVRVPAEVNGNELRRPGITIEEFARNLLASGRYPAKRR